MKAMVLAAGLGTRLRPLTNDRPKALVEVAGRTLLEITLARLREFGVGEVIVNVHHFADRVIEYLKKNGNFGMRIEISREDVLLDTGGGLKKAAWFFLEDSDPPLKRKGGAPKSLAPQNEKPFLLHNVDVISTIDLGRMVQAHVESDALATLAVQERKTSRYLLFDEQGLCGRRAGRDGEPELVRPPARVEALGFSGIHVISRRLLTMLSEEGPFSIVDAYLRLAARGEKVMAFRADQYEWRDVGKPEQLSQAAADFKKDGPQQ